MLWQRYKDLVRWRIRGKLSGARDAEVDELVQDTFLKLFRSFPHYDRARSSLGSYVCLVTDSVVYDHWRKYAREEGEERLSPEQEVRALAKAASAQGIPTEHLLRAVQRAVKRIDPPLKAVIFRELLEGKRVDDICRRRSLSPSFVYGVRRECMDLVRAVVMEFSA